MSHTRTAEQAAANDMDCNLYPLLLQAERLAARDKKWAKVVTALRSARTPIRALMHAKDRDETV